MTKEIQLPRTPSKLLQIALDDTIKSERSPFFRVKMYEWHSPFVEYLNNRAPVKLCAVCMAGSIISWTLGKDRHVHIEPDHLSNHNRDCLFAVNDFRQGNIEGAMIILGYPKETFERVEKKIGGEIFTPVYHDTDTAPFRKYIRGLIKDFKEMGL